MLMGPIPVQVAHEPDEDTEHQNTAEQGHQLGDGHIHTVSGQQEYADSAEQKGHRFHFKAHPAQSVDGKQIEKDLHEIHHPQQHQGQHRKALSLFNGGKAALDGHEQVNHHGDKKRGKGPGGTFALAGKEPAFFHVGILRRAENQLGLSHGNRVPGGNGGTLGRGNFFAVDPGSGFGAGIDDKPALFPAHQHRVVPGNGRVRQGNVTAFAASDGVFPIQHRNPGMGDGFFQRHHRRFRPAAAFDGTVAPKHHTQGQQRHNHPENQQKQVQGIRRQRIKISGKIRHHGIISFSKKRLRETPAERGCHYYTMFPPGKVKKLQSLQNCRNWEDLVIKYSVKEKPQAPGFRFLRQS